MHPARIPRILFSKVSLELFICWKMFCKIKISKEQRWCSGVETIG
jgi:hypothetical protein